MGATIARQIGANTSSIPTSFLGLQKRLFGLRPIHSKANYKKALRIASDLASRTSLTREQSDYLEILANNIKVYENEYFTGEKHSPIEILKFLVSENGMSGSDLGRVLGHRTLGPKILSGERELSKQNISVLAGCFSVEPSLFLEKINS